MNSNLLTHRDREIIRIVTNVVLSIDDSTSVNIDLVVQNALHDAGYINYEES